MNILEPYMIFITNIYCVSIVVLTLSVLLVDFPDISANATFILIRTGRARWYRCQAGFVILAATSLLILLMVFGIVAISPVAFYANVWSNSAKLITGIEHSTFRSQNPLSYPDMSVMSNFSVFIAVTVSSLLMILYMSFSALLQMALTLRYHKIVGLAVNLILLGAGMALHLADTSLKWILPFAHSTVGWHYDELFNETKFPIWGSVAYLLIANIAVYLLGIRVIKKKNLALISKED